jgi:hypothetical protein
MNDRANGASISTPGCGCSGPLVGPQQTNGIEPAFCCARIASTGRFARTMEPANKLS